MNLKPYYTNLWILRNPVIVVRVMRGFVRALVFKKPTLKTIEIFPTFACQSQCLMCSVEKYKTRSRRLRQDVLTLQDYERIAREGAKLGAIAMTVLGGEPLLSRELDHIIRIFKAQSYFVSMVSNAILMTPQRARQLRCAGLDSVYLSLESVDEAVNDRIRGFPGHYQRVRQAIRICKRARLLVGLAGVVFPGQLDRYVELLEFCRRHDLLASGGEVAAVGSAEREPLVSDEENLRLRELLQRYPRLTFDWALSYFLKVGCPAGKEKIGITCQGDVVSCSVNPIAFGNVKREPLSIVWRRMGSFSQFKQHSPRCLTAGNRSYIERYLAPINQATEHPVYYTDHPMITPATEPALFGAACAGAR